MYAIAFDMDIESLRTNYGDPYNNAYMEIKRVLQKHGFVWQQGSVYFGDERINAVTCVLAAIDLSNSCCALIRMTRKTENFPMMLGRPSACSSGKRRRSTSRSLP